MAITKKDLRVRPSAGDGVATPIPAYLTLFCQVLERTQPTTVLQTNDREQDLAQVHAAVLTKSIQVNPGLYGLTTTWDPADYHSVDPNNPTQWLNDPNLRAVMYAVGLQDGTTMYFSVGTL